MVKPFKYYVPGQALTEQFIAEYRKAVDACRPAVPTSKKQNATEVCTCRKQPLR